MLSRIAPGLNFLFPSYGLQVKIILAAASNARGVLLLELLREKPNYRAESQNYKKEKVYKKKVRNAKGEVEKRE